MLWQVRRASWRAKLGETSRNKFDQTRKFWGSEVCAVETIESPLWLLLPCGYFALRATSPCGLPRFPCWTWKVHLNIQNFLALEVQTASRCWQHLSLSHSGKMPGHHFYPRRNMSKCRDWRYNQLRLSTHEHIKRPLMLPLSHSSFVGPGWMW